MKKTLIQNCETQTRKSFQNDIFNCMKIAVDEMKFNYKENNNFCENNEISSNFNFMLEDFNSKILELKEEINQIKQSNRKTIIFFIVLIIFLQFVNYLLK